MAKEVPQKPLEDHRRNKIIKKKFLNLGGSTVLMVHMLTKQQTNQEE